MSNLLQFTFVSLLEIPHLCVLISTGSFPDSLKTLEIIKMPEIIKPVTHSSKKKKSATSAGLGNSYSRSECKERAFSLILRKGYVCVCFCCQYSDMASFNLTQFYSRPHYFSCIKSPIAKYTICFLLHLFPNRPIVFEQINICKTSEIAELAGYRYFFLPLLPPTPSLSPPIP